MYKLFMSLRYLKAHKIIYFSIAGVAMGIMVMIVVTSIMGGFSRDIRARIRGMQSHLLVIPFSPDIYITDYDALCSEIEKIEHVKGCAPRLAWTAWMEYKGTFRTVQFIGIDPEREKGKSDLEKYFRQGNKLEFNFKPDSGAETLNRCLVVGAEQPVSDRSLLRLTTVRYSDVGPIYRNQPFYVVGRFKSGMAEYDSAYVFMDLESAQWLVKLDGSLPGTARVVNELSITMDDYEKYAPVVRQRVLERIHEHLARTDRPCPWSEARHPPDRCGNFQTQTWEEAKGILLQAVANEKGIQIIILFFIVIVAGFNILAIYTLVVRSKVRDIGILRALGATEGGVTTVFLLSGMFCGLVGSLIGIGAGLLFSFHVNEIADFVELSSREFNRLDMSAKWWAPAVLVLAVVSLLVYWARFYTRGRSLIVSGPLTAILCGAGVWLFLAWAAPGTEFTPEKRWIVAGVAGGILILIDLLRHFLRGLTGDGVWSWYSFFATLIFFPLLVFIGGLIGLSTSILAMHPKASWKGLALFSKDVYYLDRIPVYVDAQTIGLIVGFTLIVSLVCSIYPSMKAAGYNPIEAIRDE